MLKSPLEQFEIVVLRPIYILWDFSITNATLYLFLAFFFIFFFFYVNFSLAYFIPGRGQRVFEMVYEFLFDMLRQTGNFPKAVPYFPIFFVIFVFILTLNLLGLTPFGFTVTGHIIVTFFLAFSFNLSFIILGFQKHGFAFFDFVYSFWSSYCIITFDCCN